MAFVKIFILLGLLALGLLNPSEVAARDIGTKLSSGRDEAKTNPVISMVTEADQNQNHKSMSFNVHNDKYEDFIKKIRGKLNNSDSRGIPTLMQRENEAWLDIRLIAGDHNISLRVQQSNLYIRGYRRSTDNFFWEFTNTNLIPGSRDLMFSGSYNGLTNTASVSRENLTLGRVQLEKAIHTLARLETPLGCGAQAAARSLLVLSQMIAEAVADRNPTPTTPPLRGSTTMRRYGRCLMNLEFVRVNNIDGEDPGNLYGTVTIDDGWGPLPFYDRSWDEYEDVGPGGFATLTDSFASNKPPSCAFGFTISVNLFDHDTFSHDDNIAQGTIVWDPLEESATFENYDKHLEQVVKGEYGDVTVGYSVFSDALDVTIEVILENGDEEKMADVYGTLRASQVLNGSAGSSPITLFQMPSGENEKVKQGELIPLTRKVIATSPSTNLTITADLWDFDFFSKDDGIAQGSVDFKVEPGMQWQYINGQFGQVKVIITCR